jgi:hypothetical protein
MTFDIETAIQMLLTGGLGMIGFFLRGIYSEIKQLAKDVRTLGEVAAKHEAHREATEMRLTRIEAKLDKL